MWPKLSLNSYLTPSCRSWFSNPLVLAQELIQKFNFGLTSSRVQVPKKAPQGWAPGWAQRPGQQRRHPPGGCLQWREPRVLHPKRLREEEGIHKVLEVSSTPLLMLLLVGSLQPSPAPSCVSGGTYMEKCKYGSHQCPYRER